MVFVASPWLSSSTSSLKGSASAFFSFSLVAPLTSLAASESGSWPAEAFPGALVGDADFFAVESVK